MINMFLLDFGTAGGLFALSLVVALLFFAVNRTLGNRRRVKEIQARMSEIQKEFKKMAESKDERELKKMEAKQGEMTDLMMESMKLSFKPLLVSLPLLFILFGFSFLGLSYGGVLNQFFPDFSITLPIALHLTGDELFGLNVLKNSVYGSRGFFILCLFVLGLLLEIVGGKLVDGPQKPKNETKQAQNTTQKETVQDNQNQDAPINPQ